MGKTFIISDTHFGHANIIKYCNRPFESTVQMDEYIAEKWIEEVGEEDTVLHLGDVAFKTQYLDEVIQSLPGRKILVWGNHDWCRTKTYYRKRGFDEVYDELLVKVGGQDVRLTHMPSDKTDMPNIHGHLHNAKNFNGALGSHNILYSPEVQDYKPMDIVDLLNEGGYPVATENPITEILGEGNVLPEVKSKES